jgi:hypothetical protein
VDELKSLFEHPGRVTRAALAGRLGLRICSQAKSAEIPYSEVERKADRLGNPSAGWGVASRERGAPSPGGEA